MDKLKNNKLWDKGKTVHPDVIKFTVGEDYLLDQKLVKYDCQASIAHAKMLGKIGILTNEETAQLEAALREILLLQQFGEFTIEPEQEDCHTAIENYLTDKLGDLGKKIHTARSRNDQVATALRLFCIAELKHCRELIQRLSDAISAFAANFGEICFPGFTHTRKAMPSSIQLWADAYKDALSDNLKLLKSIEDILDQSPLGTGAGFGVPLEIDRELTAELMEFSRVQQNPVYVQHSRVKFEALLLNGLCLIMLDLNKIASDIIWFSLPELGYFEIADEMCTGSSIMPQKKNPDVLELIRGKYSEVAACEFQVKQSAVNLISGYNRDAQLTKKPLMQALETTQSCLEMMSLVFQNLSVNKETCEAGLTEEIFATEKVYELVKKGVPFREAYRIIGREYR